MKSPQIMLLRRIAKPSLGTIIVIFLSAGRIDYWQGWLFVLANLTFNLLNVFMIWDKPDLIEERLSPGNDNKSWDITIIGLLRILFYVTILTAGLDAGRFMWSGVCSIYVYIIAFIMYAIGQSIHIWAKSNNVFFSTVVRIQKDRDHTVNTRGPYRIIRHPGYLGTITFMFATPFMLGSLWAIIPTILYTALAILRTYKEDIVLQTELLGYVEYAERVKYRLLCGIW